MNVRIKNLVEHKGFKSILYFIFTGIFYIYHIPMSYVSDDAVVVDTIQQYSLGERFVYHFYSNGRIFTDVLANVFYRMPMIVWKIFDSIMYAVIAYLIVFIFTKNRFKDVITVMALILLFPLDYLVSAGYIATTTNYIYPILALLLVLVPVKKLVDGKKVAKIWYLISALSILYTTNHDQTAVVLILGLVASLSYLLITKGNKDLIRYIVVCLIISISSYMFMFFMPGHMNRASTVGVGEGYPPNYLEWSFWKKVYVGYTSTVANIMFYEVDLFFLVSILCLLIVFEKKRTPILYLCGVLPTLSCILVQIVGRSRFVTIYDYSYWLPDLIPITSDVLTWIPLILSIAIIISIVVIICTCVVNKENKYLLLLLLILAAASREIMGFSATVFKSSFRTFSFFMYALIVCCIVLLQETEESGNKYLQYIGMTTILLLKLL